ncbi:unnamed protein product [Thelazia callipaeda]|uniref:Hexosyltransferase n=1 Tax=Thelazia callipaeda TaxID=103827 RepID=A0A0N5DB94_THECL|nr:unnamed protein product [Thelazia callipaeda]
MKFAYFLRKLIFGYDSAIPCAWKLFLLQSAWIIPYLLVVNYLERSLLPLRLFCYTQNELLVVPKGEKINLRLCLQRFFSTSQLQSVNHSKCLYKQPIKTLITPKISHNQSKKIGVIRSAPSSRDYRDFIRKTYKSGLEPEIIVFFALGTGDYNPLNESEIYHDILQFDFVDSYHNLTLKMISIYNELFNRFDNLQEILVINDDILVNITAIKKLNSFENATISGKVTRGFPRIILNSSKWYIPYEMYPKLCYPPFVQGGGFIITREAALRVIENICSFPSFYLDDVFMGILANCLGIKMEHINGFDKSYPSKFITFHHQWHRYSVKQLQLLYHTINYL